MAYGALAQLARAPALQAGGPGFESPTLHQFVMIIYYRYKLVETSEPENTVLQSKKGFGVVNEAKKCLHFFVREWKSRRRCPRLYIHSTLHGVG